MKDDTIEELAAWVRDALCVTADRDQDIVEALRSHPAPDEREITTIWWDVN
jgi:hypothetical protein